MKRHLSFALIASLSFLTCTDEPGKIRLSFNYQPGEMYAYEMTDDVEYQTTGCSGEITNVSRQQKQITKIQVVEKDSVESLYKLLVSFSLVSDTIMYPEDYKGEKKKASKERLGRI